MFSVYKAVRTFGTVFCEAGMFCTMYKKHLNSNKSPPPYAPFFQFGGAKLICEPGAV